MKTMIIKKASKLLLIGMVWQLSMFTVHAQCMEVVKQSIETESFNSIKVDGSVKLTIEQGLTENISFEGDKNTIEKISTEVKNGVLTLSGLNDAKVFEVKVTFKELSSLVASGASQIRSSSLIKTSEFDVKVDGSARVNLEIATDKLNTHASGAGIINYKGSATEHHIKILGAAKINAFNLETNKTDVQLSGAGIAHVNVKNDLSGSISGLGNIYYASAPEIINIETTGLGKVGLASERQIKDTELDTTRFKLGSSEILILTDPNEQKEKKTKKNKFNGHWGGLELGVNGFLSSANKTEMPTGYDFLDLKYNKSLNLNINLYEENFNLYKNKIGIVSGLGFSFHNYQFVQNTTLLPAQKDVDAITDTMVTFIKNKLRVSYLTMPVLLEAQAGKKSQFHISGGVLLGLRMNSFTYQTYKLAGAEYENKVKDNFNLNPYKVDLTARVGYGMLNLYANYALTTLFKSSKTPEIYPFTVGVRLLGW